MTITPRYSNRELSLLDFQERVLALAEDTNLPLLERVRFVGIVAANLDEFFQVRVAGLREQATSGVEPADPAGMSPREQLAALRIQCGEIHERMERLLATELIPELTEQGIRISDWDELDDDQRKHLEELFEREIFPVLTPLAVDPTHPFPYISNLSLNLAVTVRDPDRRVERFARVKVPPLLPRFLSPAGSETFVPVEQVIAAHLDSLFPGMQIVNSHPFRVTRSADQPIEEEEADDLLKAVEELLQTRHRASKMVRLEIDETMPEPVLDLLMDEMGIGHDQVYAHTGLLALAGLTVLTSLSRPDLLHRPWQPTTQPTLAQFGSGESIFDRIKQQDILVHLPYESFGSSVGAFIAAAARDPHVVAIKQTLYRTSMQDDPALGGEQSIVKSLIAAARSGKQVVVLVELRARFDEEANIVWARLLEESGVHVVYGVAGLKTHAKVALVVRREGDGLRRYAHVGTGNYNPKTARLYEDLGLLTADEAIGADLTDLFNMLTGFGHEPEFRCLLVAPAHLRRALVDRIRAQAGRGAKGRITMKLNHIADRAMIDELYAASTAGVRIDLIVRGICSLVPGIAGWSENITVRSIVGRYLEHSRVFRFGEGDKAEYFIGSADLMERNLAGRVEVLVPIRDPRLRTRLEELLRVCLADDRLAWELEGDTWDKIPTMQGLNTHVRLQALAHGRSQGALPDPDSATDQAEPTIIAAGGIVTKETKIGTEVLVVHRPRYGDWTFPKGKLDGDESLAEGALREVLEETGFVCDLGPEIGMVEYRDRSGGRKYVHYFAMSVESGSFTPNREVDKAKWLGSDDAAERLTYARDRALLRSWLGAP
jgi:polyphosphate kinase